MIQPGVVPDLWLVVGARLFLFARVSVGRRFLLEKRVQFGP